jgi:hypothetical protein
VLAGCEAQRDATGRHNPQQGLAYACRQGWRRRAGWTMARCADRQSSSLAVPALDCLAEAGLSCVTCAGLSCITPNYLAMLCRTVLRCYIRLSCDEDGSELYHSCRVGHGLKNTYIHTWACMFWIWVWAWAWLSLKGGGCSEARLSSKQESSIG